MKCIFCNYDVKYANEHIGCDPELGHVWMCYLCVDYPPIYEPYKVSDILQLSVINSLRVQSGQKAQ